MITPDKLDERSTLADLARLLNAFGLMLTCKPVAGAAYEATVSDERGIIGHADGSTLAEAIRFTFTDYMIHADADNKRREKWLAERAKVQP